MGNIAETTGLNQSKVNSKASRSTRLMDLYHLKNSELEKQFHKHKGRAVLRGDIVKHDSGNDAVFTEQGASASHMTAANLFENLADTVHAWTCLQLGILVEALRDSQCRHVYRKCFSHKKGFTTAQETDRLL